MLREKMKERFKIFGCVISLIIKDNKVLMILRKNKPDSGYYNLVGGRMEEGETVPQAIIREIQEETGLNVNKEDISVVSTLHRLCDNGNYNSIEFVTLIKNFTGMPQNLEPQFCEKLAWIDINNMPENISPYARTAIENYKNKIVFSEIDY